jgi:hypothetical protein
MKMVAKATETCRWKITYDQTYKVTKMIVGVLTTCHTQYAWDRSICIFLFNRTTLQVFVTYLTGALYVHLLWLYKHQHDNRVRSKLFIACHRWWFQWRFDAILVNCAPNGEMHKCCIQHIIKENFENFLIHRCKYILLSKMYCVWQVVETPTIILNYPVFHWCAFVGSLRKYNKHLLLFILHNEVSFPQKWNCMLRYITRVHTRCVQKWISVLNTIYVRQKTRSIFPVPRNTISPSKGRSILLISSLSSRILRGKQFTFVKTYNAPSRFLTSLLIRALTVCKGIQCTKLSNVTTDICK